MAATDPMTEAPPALAPEEDEERQLVLLPPSIDLDSIVDIADTAAGEAINVEDIDGPFLIFDIDFNYAAKFQNSAGDAPAEVTLIRYMNDPASWVLRQAYAVSEKIAETAKILVEQGFCTPEKPVLCKFDAVETNNGRTVKKLVACKAKEKADFLASLKERVKA